MNRFGFIIHPIEVADVARKYPLTRYLPGSFVEWLAKSFVKPKVVSEITGITSTDTGNEVTGVFIGCPLTTRVLLEAPAEQTVPVIVESAKLAAAEGAEIVGLGAMTSVAGDAGFTVESSVDIAVTTGNSYTVYTALEAARNGARLMGIDLSQAHVAVVGATGSIGRVCAQVMADEAARVTLLGRNLEKTTGIAESIGERHPAVVDASTDLPGTLPDCDLVICVSSSVDALVGPEHLKPGAVICDVARPRDVSVAVAEKRDDVLVIEGGVVKPPGDNVDFHFNFGFPPGLCYACMAETALLAVAQRFESYSLGRELEYEKILGIGAMAKQHGFELAGFRSFERAVTEEQIDGIRKRAGR